MRKFAKKLGKMLAPSLLEEDLFKEDISIDRSKGLFSKYVTHVELENHNFCNRTCWFCPNCQIDRKSNLSLMDDAVFEKIISGLAAIDFREGVFWARYHEPLAEDSIYERLAYARKKLPFALLVVYSNGDYVKPEILEKLSKAGLNRLRMSLYINYTNVSQDSIGNEIKKFEDRTGLKVTNECTNCGFVVSGADMDVFLSLPFFKRSDKDNITSSRGGVIELEGIEHLNRKSVCFNPVHSLTIDYNGKIILCCHLRSL